MDRDAATAERWYAAPVERLFQHLQTSPHGLSESDAAQRLRESGPNRLPRPKRISPARRFVRQFNNVLIYVLIGSAVVTALLQHWVDAAVILGVVLINAAIGFVQEGKAEKALDAIRGMLSLHASVRREGQRREIAAEELVPGDIVLLAAGDKVPADMRLLESRDLRVQEAALTGESVPVEKNVSPVAEQVPLGDRSSMAYSGTLVTYGRGTGVVVATGAETELGRISAMLRDVETLETPLLRQIGQFSRWLTGGILLLSGAAFLFGMLVNDTPASDMFLAAVAIAVAAIPEGLPAIITIALAVGVQRMARRNAIIRRLPAVETLGSVGIICTDKTGTLTRNEMTVNRLVTAMDSFDVTGGGYEPRGAFVVDGREIVTTGYPDLEELLRAALLCNDAVVRPSDEGWSMQGDPTEGALMTLAMKGGMEPAQLSGQLPRIDAIPFESEHRYMATLHHDHAGRAVIYVKGAPERVLAMCATQLAGGREVPLDRAHWSSVMEGLAAGGQRVLALAQTSASPDKRALDFEDVAQGLCLLGVVGITDPPRPEAIDAVAECRAAGIRVKMITGDHVRTALAIARQVGLAEHGRAVEGAELERIDDASLADTAQSVDVFARTSPEHKLRLVRALQSRREVVAMTGDGVNDAPALKRADVGVAMGRKGTEAAKEAAEMVLADDNFASIARAVKEGRTVYDNITKSILFLLPTSVGEAFTIVLAILLAFELPITAVQILWVNMITAVTLGLCLAMEPPEADVMKRLPRDPRAPILSPLLVWRILFVSAIVVAGVFGIYVWQRAGASLEYARTAAVNTLVMFEAFYLLTTRFVYASALTRAGLTGNPYVVAGIGAVVVFQMLFTYAPPMQLLFGTQSLQAVDWLWVVLVASSVLLLVEAEKWLVRRWPASRCRL